jgi:hypothetical protein
MVHAKSSDGPRGPKDLPSFGGSPPTPPILTQTIGKAWTAWTVRVDNLNTGALLTRAHTRARRVASIPRVRAHGDRPMGICGLPCCRPNEPQRGFWVTRASGRMQGDGIWGGPDGRRNLSGCLAGCYAARCAICLGFREEQKNVSFWCEPDRRQAGCLARGRSSVTRSDLSLKTRSSFLPRDGPL